MQKLKTTLKFVHITIWKKHFQTYFSSNFKYNFSSLFYIPTSSYITRPQTVGKFCSSLSWLPHSRMNTFTLLNSNRRITNVYNEGYLLESKFKCEFLNLNLSNMNYFPLYNLTQARNYSNKRINIDKVSGHISSLKSKKRIQRRKRSVDESSDVNADGFQNNGPHRFLTFDPDFDMPDIAEPQQPQRDFQMVACATADEYDLESLSEGFHKQGLYVETSIVEEIPKDSSSPSSLKLSSKYSHFDPENVIQLAAAYQVSAEPRTMHVFREGVIVFWNMPLLERQNILKFVENYQSGKYAEDIVEEEMETLIYTYADSATRLKASQNLILLNEKGEKDLEKFAFSNALSMSVKLGIWEASLDRYIDSIEHVTEELSKSGFVGLTQEQVLQRMGQLFALRHMINLSSDLLDTPDFYWEHESLGHLYNKTANYLSIQKRTSVMNTKLNHCLELMELLKSHLNERHASRLEWIIIILIMIEVFFEILHYV